MNSYAAYVADLDNLCRDVAAGIISNNDDKVIAALNWQPASKLQQLVSYDIRKESGAFFSGKFLSQGGAPIINPVDILKWGGKIFDPACGAGDLLVEVAKNISIENDFDTTMEKWGGIFHGKDLHLEFILAARARLALTALHKGAKPSTKYIGINRILKNVQQGCGIDKAKTKNDFTCILMNPPYSMIEAPTGCKWSTGKTNYAALFFHDYVLCSREGTRLVAILPEVLRSGSRYERWRETISKRLKINKITRLGQFESNVDVNVFYIDASTDSSGGTDPVWCDTADSPGVKIKDFFKISVGPVVDFRDPKDGSFLPYIVSKGLPKWVVVEEVPHKRRYPGKTISSPFVVVRRTSRPDDKFRALATIINLKEAAAVDNHLIVLEPKDGNIETCHSLLKVLENNSSSDWLNQRIRCRHLTVSSLGDMPWGNE